MQPWDHLRPVDRINQNYATFDRLVNVAENYFEKRQYDHAAAYTQVAADFAWCNHPGLFSSSRLEKILLDIRASLKFTSISSRKQSSPKQILHVMTQAYPVGGHTRLVANWIEKDTTHKHSLVLTRQRQLPIPESLAVGVDIHLLDEKRGGLLNRAKRLRELAAGFDLIVLHIHPYDVVPTLAFAHDQNVPPVIFLQHADIVFYLGTSVGDVVAHVREESLEVSHRRRGIDPVRSFVMPIPLQLKSRKSGRAEAKSRLGIDPSRTVLLTVASEYKFANPGGITYAEAVAPVLEVHPNAELFVIGPRESPEWSTAAERVGGRIHVLGVVDDPTPYYEAADIYLNSFPVGALTSLLEAGSYELPLVSYQQFSDEYTLLRCSDPALKETLMIETELEEYRRTLSGLINNTGMRKSLGEQTRVAIVDLHAGDGWYSKLEELYERAAGVRKLITTYPIESERELSEEDKGVIWMNNSLIPPDMDDTEHSRLLPAKQRVEKWNSLGRKEWRLLLPESIGTYNERLAQRLWRSLLRR
jgi:hypothetical protein